MPRHVQESKFRVYMFLAKSLDIAPRSKRCHLDYLHSSELTKQTFRRTLKSDDAPKVRSDVLTSRRPSQWLPAMPFFSFCHHRRIAR